MTKNNVDGPGGIDNAFANFLATQDGGRAAATTNNSAEAGLLAAVLRISGYNGLPDDGQVVVAIYAASGCRLGGPLSYICPTSDGGVPFAWQGNDEWSPLIGWVEPVTGADGSITYRPKYVSSRAYVTNDVLVAHFEEVRGAMVIEYSDVWVQAHVRHDPGNGSRKISLTDGVFAGRASLDSLLSNVEFWQDATSGTPKPICMDSTAYRDFKRRACSYADVSFKGNDAGATCDATSWAWKFDADPARLSDSPLMVTETAFRSCTKDGHVSPEHDRCDSGDAGAP